MLINETTVELTQEQKLVRTRKIIGRLFLNVKQSINRFDSEIDKMLDENPFGLTKTEVLTMFTGQVAELNQIKTNLKTIADNITK